MYLTPNRFKRHPFTVWFIGPLWGILNTKADPPYIREEFDTEDEAWVHALALNQSYWSEQEAKSAAYWAIQKASEESLDHAAANGGASLVRPEQLNFSNYNAIVCPPR